MLRIGVDVGGTNTDAVVMAGRDIRAVVKVPTSADVTSGLMQALLEVQARAGVAPHEIGLVVIGTTHFTNAVIERRSLCETAVVRLCLPAAQCLPPMVDWPADLRAVVGDHVFFASGGVEFDGSPIAPFDPADVRRIGRVIRERGIQSIALAGVFAPVDDRYELEAAALLAEECPGAHITLSSTIGQIGLLERESATILNSALQKLARRTVAALREGVAQCGITCAVYLSQNDGTLMASEQAERYPVLTFASGPTNSMRGAAFLCGRSEAIVIDIGGTTTDVGLLHKGFPRQAGSTVDVGGVRTNFRMPDVFSIGLGGGSMVVDDLPEPRVGPQSVGYELLRHARVFGGDSLTATDIAVATGRARIGDAARVFNLDRTLAQRCQAVIDRRLAIAADRARVSAELLPVIAVGGGSILMPATLGPLEVIRPEHFAVANAIGAAIAQISGHVDRIYSLDAMSREAALRDAENEARGKAIASGAHPGSIQVTEMEDVPLSYLRGNATRVRVKVVGDMRF